MVVAAIDHFNIKTPLFAETVAFYEALLGLVQVPAATMVDQSTNVWLAAEDGRALIHVNTLMGEDRPAGLVSRLDHVAFAIADVAELRRRLAAHDIPHQESGTRVPGLGQIVVRDPNGIKVELTLRA